MFNNEISDLNLPSIILCDNIDSILEKELTDDEFILISSMRKTINSDISFYKISDLNNFFLISLTSDFYSAFKFETSYHKEKIIYDLVQYRRNCKKISDKLESIKYKNYFNEDIEMSLFEFSSAFCIPFYDAYSMYLKYSDDFSELLKNKDDNTVLRKDLYLFMKIIDEKYLMNIIADIKHNYLNIINMKNECQFQLNNVICSNNEEIASDYLNKLCDLINYYLSLFVLLDEKEIITKELMSEEDEEYIIDIGNSIINKVKIDLNDVRKIYSLSQHKCPSKSFNTKLIDAIINENYDFLQKGKSKIIDFNSDLKK